MKRHKILAPEQEQKLAQAAEQIVLAVNNGGHPEDAFVEVVQKFALSPHGAAVVAQAFNKSSAAHHLKTAGQEERTAGYPLIDVPKALRKAFPDISEEEREKAASASPKKDYSGLGFKLSLRWKQASRPGPTIKDVTDLYSELVKTAIDSNKHLLNIFKRAHDRLVRANVECKRALEDLSEDIGFMHRKQLHKFAGVVYNVFGPTARPVLVKAANSPDMVPEFRKTAQAAVLPPEKSYIDFVRCVDAVTTALEAERDMKAAKSLADRLFSKIALSPTLERIVKLTGMGSNKDKGPDLDDLAMLHISARNALKELQTRRAFYELAAADPDFGKYTLTDLIKAFNYAVSLNPEAITNRPLLKSLMLYNLETGFSKDPLALKAETDIAKNMITVSQATDKRLQELQHLLKERSQSRSSSQVNQNSLSKRKSQESKSNIYDKWRTRFYELEKQLKKQDQQQKGSKNGP